MGDTAQGGGCGNQETFLSMCMLGSQSMLQNNKIIMSPLISNKDLLCLKKEKCRILCECVRKSLPILKGGGFHSSPYVTLLYPLILC